ncbi:hypothetical protein U9M48_015503 [Paspalum notatum var. saurae]|uniref:Integrase catalytic domain-containing protein n=1 Tax=Paspalum notatum var. saurae TaxID=547442 RepID=A0AAQ3T4B8_PASNO
MGGREVVLERVVEKATAAVTYPMLTRTNYTEWSLVMRVNLQAAGLWEVVNTGEGEYRDDRNALAALLRAVPQEMQAGLAVKETAKEAWEAIKAVRVGVERVKEANAEKLRKEFNELKFKAGEGVEDFSLRLNTLANQLRVLGEDISEKEVVKRLLHSVPESLEQVAISIETLLNLSEVSFEEVARECRQKKAEANFVQEEEGALLMVRATQMVESAPEPTSRKKDVRHIQLEEKEVFIQLDDEGVRETKQWVLDTGATNHMSGSRVAFAELDTDVCGTVRFGDNSVTRVEGCGTVLFICKNGEHQVLSNVYHIPCLTANIVSVGQLNEAGHEILINKEGVMKVKDPCGRLLAHVPRKANRLFVLNITIAQPVCLSVRAEEEAWKWHARLGHLNFQAMRTLARKEMVRGLPELTQVNQLCEGCMASKQRRPPFPAKVEHSAERALELVHGDLCVPISPPTPSGSKYFLLLVDDSSRYMWVKILCSKDQAAAAIKQFQAEAEAETGKKLGALRTDRGGEFTSVDFMEYCTENGIRRQLTAPYSPQQNGVVERRNGTVVATTRKSVEGKGTAGMAMGRSRGNKKCIC